MKNLKAVYSFLPKKRFIPAFSILTVALALMFYSGSNTVNSGVSTNQEVLNDQSENNFLHNAFENIKEITEKTLNEGEVIASQDDKSTQKNNENTSDNTPANSNNNSNESSKNNVAQNNTAPTVTPTTYPTPTNSPIPTSTPIPIPTNTPTPLPTNTPVPTPIVSNVKIRAYYHQGNSDITVDRAPVKLVIPSTGETKIGTTNNNGYSPIWQVPANTNFEVYLYPPRHWVGNYCGSMWSKNTGYYGTTQSQHLRIFPQGQVPCYTE